MCSDTDLNKSSRPMHDCDKQSTQSHLTGRLAKSQCLGHTPLSIVLGSWFDQSNEQSTIDHSRAPNEEICITASHSETTNQHAQSAGLARQARSDFMAAKEQGTLRYPHSLILTDYSPAQSCVQRAITTALCLPMESSLGSSIFALLTTK